MRLQANKHQDQQNEHSGYLLLGIFASSIFVTLLFWQMLPSSLAVNESSDYLTFYKPVAQSVLAGEGLFLDGHLATMYPPGYPVLLALLFRIATLLGLSSDFILSVFAVASMGSASVLLFIPARCLWSPYQALLVPISWLSYPFALWMTKQPNSEIPFLVTFYAAVTLFLYYLLIKQSQDWWPYGVVGLLVGLSMLIRPAAIGLGIVFAFILWFGHQSANRPQRMWLILLLLTSNLLTILPWEMWVYARSNQVILLSTNGVASIRDGLTFAAADKGYRQDIAIPDTVETFMERTFAKTKAGELENFSDIFHWLTAELQHDPGTVLQLYLLKAARSWYGTDSGRFEPYILAAQLVYLALCLWATWRGWQSRGTSRLFVVAIWVIVFYFWGMTILALSILRYMVPAIGLLFILLPAIFSSPPVCSASHQFKPDYQLHE